MSVYKTVSNYYVDILDYLEFKKKQHVSIDAYFTKISNGEKKEILVKLSDTLLRIHMLFKARHDYWKSKLKENDAIFGIMITIAIVIGIVFFSIFVLRYFMESTFKYPDGAVDMNRIIKALINYCTIYMVILTVFVAAIKNAEKMKKLYKFEKARALRDSAKYSKQMFLESNDSIETGLLALAILSRQREIDEKSLETVEPDLLDVCGKKNNSDRVPYPIKDMSSKYYDCEKRTVDFVKAYDSMAKSISSSMKRFSTGPGNDIDGYAEVRQMYVVSGPVPMLKETNRVMNSYYAISLKERQGKDNKEPDPEQQKKILKDVLIDPLAKALEEKEDVDPKAFEKAKTIKEFSAKFDTLKKMFLICNVYFFVIYHADTVQERHKNVMKYLDFKEKNNLKNIFFPIEKTFDELNMTAALEKPEPKTLAHIVSMKFEDRVKKDATPEEKQNLMRAAASEVLQPFQDAIGSIVDALVKNEIDYRFAFEKTFVELEALSLSKAYPSTKYEEYLKLAKTVMFEDIVRPVKSRMELFDREIRSIVEKTSATLAAQSIPVRKYNDYIISEATKNVKPAELSTKTNIVSDALATISKKIAMIRQIKQQSKIEERFVDQGDFVELIDDMTYRNLRESLEPTHLSFIVHEFYKKINDSIARDDPSLDNIYFNVQKKLDIWKTIMIMTIVTLCLVWSNYTYSVYQLMRFLTTDLKKPIAERQNAIRALRLNAADYAKPSAKPAGSEEARAETRENEAKIQALQQKIKTEQFELELLYRERRNRIVNWTIRMFIPLFVIVFVIALIYSFWKKAEDTHRFNTQMIENNTIVFKGSLDQLNEKLSVIASMLDAQQFNKKIKDIPSITADMKHSIYSDVKQAIDKYEKCNFILESQSSKLPFPYSEVVMGGFMIFVTVMCVFYVYAKFRPMARLRQIRELNQMKREASIADMDAIQQLKKELEYQLSCHEDDIDTIIFTMKVIFFIFIITFLIFYSTRVISSSSDYLAGLYNSVYFESSNCVSG